MNQTSSTSSSRSFSKKSLADIVISAMMLALALAIKGISQLIPFSNLPYGGSITIILVPLCLVGLLCGPIWGIVVPVLFSVFNFLWDGVSSWTANTSAVILTLFLDYIVAFGFCGISSLFRKPFFEKKAYAPLLAVLLSGILRLISHFFSGVIVWNNIWDYEGPIVMDWSKAGITYSLVYNTSYMIPTIILSLLVMAYLLKPMYTLFSMPLMQSLKPKSVLSSDDNDDKLPSYRLLSFIFAFLFLAGALLALIPQLKMNYLGYFVAPLTLASFVYEIVHMIRHRKEKIELYDILMIIVFFILLALAVVGILSRYTYGASFYAA